MPNRNLRLDLNRLRGAINRHGTLVRIDRAEFCECGSIGSEQTPNYACPDCNGIGVRFYSPMSTMVLMLSKSSKEMIERYGILEEGTIGITIPDIIRDRDTGELITDYIPAMFDKFTCLRERIRFSEVLTRGEVHPISGRSKEKAAFLEIISGTCRITQRGGTIFQEGVDFQIEPDESEYNRKIAWIDGGSSPDPDERYSITYQTHPTYLISPKFLPRHRREANRMILSHVVAEQVNLVEQFK